MVVALLTLLLGCAPAAPTPDPGATDPPLPSPAPSEPDATPPSATDAERTPARPLVCGAAAPVGPYHPQLIALAERAGLDHPDAFAGVAVSLRDLGKLPDCYLTKRDAERAGWSRSLPVWRTLPGRSIGGDHFGNYERHLPEGRYREADLDDDGDRRGPHRLVYAEDVQGTWRMWITVDHYGTFTDVAAAMQEAP